MIVTLATLQILKGISYIITGAIPVFGFTEGFKVIGQGYLGPIPIPIIIMLVLYVIAYIILTYTSFGQSIYAIGGNEEAVRLTGINIRKQKYLAYILCSLITAVAGIVLLSRLTAQLVLVLDMNGCNNWCSTWWYFHVWWRRKDYWSFCRVLVMAILRWHTYDEC